MSCRKTDSSHVGDRFISRVQQVSNIPVGFNTCNIIWWITWIFYFLILILVFRLRHTCIGKTIYKTCINIQRVSFYDNSVGWDVYRIAYRLNNSIPNEYGSFIYFSSWRLDDVGIPDHIGSAHRGQLFILAVCRKCGSHHQKHQYGQP
ncbi:hypothetical protein C900_01587 [Fulvivirga imtechensis AK7]|uniref:Uncharacterized protein n=1 Tax=Fulvivirga imtechensis AK7 TaxID=1237149 RepID=L8JU57_9BACT|nr:hypothetical protein C900_01587 [Fulvivirga imtechensis AK7]